jgi:cystathionine beta-synthase
VKNFMTTNLVILNPNDKITEVINILSSGMVPIIVDKGRFLGLITKIDLINYLNKKILTNNEIFD